MSASCGVGCGCSNQGPLDLDDIRKKYPNPRPEITVEPLNEEDIKELGLGLKAVTNPDGETVGYALQPAAAAAAAVRPSTPPMFRYPADRADLAEFSLRFFGECMQIAREKNLRYAGDTDPFKNFRLGGAYGIAIRMTDKVSRLLTLTEPGNKIDGGDESIEDTCRDLANYAMLLSAMRANERS